MSWARTAKLALSSYQEDFNKVVSCVAPAVLFVYTTAKGVHTLAVSPKDPQSGLLHLKISRIILMVNLSFGIDNSFLTEYKTSVDAG